jgi:hypothetical protein
MPDPANKFWNNDGANHQAYKVTGHNQARGRKPETFKRGTHTQQGALQSVAQHD